MIVLATVITTSSLIIARSISKPLDRLTKGAEIIGAGDLEHKVEVKSKDELGQLAAAFNEMTGSLKEITASRDELDREVTVRKQIQEQLLLTDNAVRSSPSGIAISDLNGNITYVNPTFLEMWGYDKPEEILGHPATSFWKEPDKAQRIIEALVTRKGAEVAELVAKRKDETDFIAEVRASLVVNAEGQPVALTSSFNDTTERKQAEEEILKANTELTAVNKELEAFAYSVSHDLRAPLRSVDGFSQVLLEDYPDRLDERGKDYLNRVRSASQHMAQLIDDMLKLSRVTRGEMKHETVDLSALAQTIVAELKEHQPERQLEFITSEGLIVNGDVRLLQVLLENLFGNAWKFTGQHLEARIEFGASQVNGKETFFIRDDGVGFDMAYVDKLFGAFQRLHAADEFSGTGIGLATAQRIVHRHGGRAWAEGEVEKGATFYFTLQ